MKVNGNVMVVGLVGNVNVIEGVWFSGGDSWQGWKEMRSLLWIMGVG